MMTLVEVGLIAVWMITFGGVEVKIATVDGDVLMRLQGWSSFIIGLSVQVVNYDD